MIAANLASQTRALEQRLLMHARRMVTNYGKRRKVAAEDAWRSADLLWPHFKQDD